MATTPTSKEHEVDEVVKQIVDSIQSLGEQLQTDMDCFRQEKKTENLDGLKATICDIEKSLGKAWEHVDDHDAELKALKDVKDSRQKEIDELKFK